MLLDLLNAAQARRDLHDPDVGGKMDSEGIYELCKEAGLGEEEAMRAAQRRGLERLRRGLSA